MTKLISGIPPLGKPVLYTIGLCFVSLFLIYSMDVSTMSWLRKDIIDKVKYESLAEFPLAVTVDVLAPGKNTVDDRNCVATAQPGEQNND